MSDEYTPTTDWVRAAYTRAVPERLVASQVEMMAEFDRWLAGVLADAKAEQHAATMAREVRHIENDRDFLRQVADSYGIRTDEVTADFLSKRAAAYRVEGEGKNDVHE